MAGREKETKQEREIEGEEKEEKRTEIKIGLSRLGGDLDG